MNFTNSKGWQSWVDVKAGDHGGKNETSLMMHYHPDMVRLDLIPDDAPADFPPYDMFPPHRHWVPESGALTSAKGATAAKGRIMAEQLVADIAAAIGKEFARPAA